ncbi:MAG: CRISPR-associated protein Cas4 [Thermoprotei archaeon]|nr:MAG: CRISPR-associated protein Cas4 [Thermoprotei archaeon]
MIIELLYKLRREEFLKHRREANVYWVSDLVKCPIKREFEIKYPEIALSSIYSPYYILGDLIHKGLESVISEKLNARVEVEKSINVQLSNGMEVIVKGRIDSIITTERGENIGIEIKSARADIGIPQQHHIDQVRIYNWLFDLTKSILIYITFNRVTEYEVVEKASTEEVIYRIEDKKAPRYSWECGYCSYAILCPYKIAK